MAEFRDRRVRHAHSCEARLRMIPTGSRHVTHQLEIGRVELKECTTHRLAFPDNHTSYGICVVLDADARW